MRKTPFAHASLAALYIASLVSGGYAVCTFAGDTETIVIPMTVLSLFVISAAVMGFLFVSEPLFIAIEGKRKEAVSFFLRTVGFFAIYVVIFGTFAISMSFL